MMGELAFDECAMAKARCRKAEVDGSLDMLYPGFCTARGCDGPLLSLCRMNIVTDKLPRMSHRDPVQTRPTVKKTTFYFWVWYWHRSESL